MRAEKTVAISFRVSERFKSLLKAAAERERRSQANLIQVLLFDYCARCGIAEGAMETGDPTKQPGKAETIRADGVGGI